MLKAVSAKYLTLFKKLQTQSRDSHSAGGRYPCPGAELPPPACARSQAPAGTPQPGRARGLKPPRRRSNGGAVRRTVLQAGGHQLTLEEIPDWNAVELVVSGETVFRCNINELGGDGKLDPLCEEARKAALNAY
ncbi:PREDICTED: UPF0728 protein C10orf53 homolog [Nipponia nippon]|uniref:UPF0728 protein C10orf53 homolog n=1 Tax=Nipponia nippon TaxID=128390 RepID=UPI000510BE60|nr:PREDICTED: UPF0728 protein C10orf53 homolog [Nipponia nippon]